MLEPGVVGVSALARIWNARICLIRYSVAMDRPRKSKALYRTRSDLDVHIDPTQRPGSWSLKRTDCRAVAATLVKEWLSFLCLENCHAGPLERGTGRPWYSMF